MQTADFRHQPMRTSRQMRTLASGGERAPCRSHPARCAQWPLVADHGSRVVHIGIAGWEKREFASVLIDVQQCAFNSHGGDAVTAEAGGLGVAPAELVRPRQAPCRTKGPQWLYEAVTDFEGHFLFRRRRA